jgi:16S rRNA (guanine1207-N2)-methyltransferase
MARRRKKRGYGGDPLVSAKLEIQWGGRKLQLLGGHSLFSSHRIDGGTRLLLESLPAREPGTYLDLGCGYGAMGLPIAARFPSSRGLLVDRDLLAVELSRRNSALQGIANVEVAPSLGYRDIPPAWGPFDWILSNVPARARERVIEHFVSEGRSRLTDRGEMRIVAISSLKAMVEKIALDLGLSPAPVAETAHHAVFSFPPGKGSAAGEDIYFRDKIELDLPERLELERPTDLADEPHRLKTAIPLLLTCLPASPPGRILVFRAGYGLLPALALARYPGARVIAVDRDLLATAYTSRNTRRWPERIRVVESLGLSGVLALGPFDLILGELSPPLGPEATLAELSEVREALAPGANALILGLLKQWREFVKGSAESLRVRLFQSEGPAALYKMA